MVPHSRMSKMDGLLPGCFVSHLSFRITCRWQNGTRRCCALHACAGRSSKSVTYDEANMSLWKCVKIFITLTCIIICDKTWLDIYLFTWVSWSRGLLDGWPVVFAPCIYYYPVKLGACVTLSEWVSHAATREIVLGDCSWGINMLQTVSLSFSKSIDSAVLSGSFVTNTMSMSDSKRASLLLNS